MMKLGMLIRSSSRNKPGLDIFRDFHSYTLPDIVSDNTLHIWCLISMYHSSNVKIIHDVHAALLSNSFNDC